MRAHLMLARKEVLEILRTWRICVLPSIMLLVAVTGPVLARYTPQLLGAVGGSPFASLQLPEPTVFDSYGQWIKNLSQIVIFAQIIMYGGIISSERRSGTAVLVLTKPVSRTGFVVVKAVVHAMYLAVLLVAGTLATWCLTAVVFGQAPGGALWSSALLWLVTVVTYLCLMTLFSSVIPSAAGAAGLGLGAFTLISIAAIWEPAREYSPAGLPGVAASLAAGVDVEVPFWPVMSSFVVCIGAVGLAVAVFRRKEL